MTNDLPSKMDHEWWAARILPRFTDAELEKERAALERVLAANTQLTDIPIWLAALRNLQADRASGKSVPPT